MQHCCSMHSVPTTSQTCLVRSRGVHPIPHAQWGLPSRHQRVNSTTCSAWGRGNSSACTPQLSVAPDPLSPVSGVCLEPQQCWKPTALFVGVALLGAAFLLNSREKRVSVREQPELDTLGAGGTDPRHHQRVLAKARQATHINSAVSYNRAGEFTKAMLELSKALGENSVCRAPALLAHSKEDLESLYRLHMRYSEQPPNFATLLQLQEMLGLTSEEAERVELELMQSPSGFAI